MDTKEKKLKAIADAAAKKNISLDTILKYVEKTPAKTHDKKYQFVFHWIRLARPMYKKKGFSNRKVHIRLCKHPRFHYLLDGFYKASEKKKFNDNTKLNKAISHRSHLPIAKSTLTLHSMLSDPNKNNNNKVNLT